MMARLAGDILLFTVLFGAWLAVYALRPLGRPPPRQLPWVHGGFGAVGVVLMGGVLAAADAPVSTLSWEALALAVLALLAGLLLWRRRLGASRGMVVALHAIMGAAGAVLLAGWAG